MIQLTTEQKTILNNCHKNIYVSSAPGSGKSTLLSFISEKLLEDKNNYIMLITFTNKAAKSILGKCSNLDKNRIIGGTFHSIIYRMLKQNGGDHSICDEHKKRMLIKKLFKVKGQDLEDIISEISKAKMNWPRENNNRINLYQNELAKYNLIDFDDIIFKGIEEVHSFKKIPNITHILVDELQDTSGSQLQFLIELQKKTGTKMIGCADDDQAIYSWRGARPANVRDFITNFNCDIYNMGYNFRCSKSVVERSKTLIKNNEERIEKTINAARLEEGSVFSIEFENEFEEIDYIVSLCRINYNREITVLYRNRRFKSHLEFQLRKVGLRYKVNDFLEITDRSAVKVMLSIIRFSVGIYDIYDLKNAAKALRGFGLSSVKLLANEADSSIDLELKIQELFEDKKYERRFSSLKKLRKFVSENRDKPLDILMFQIEKYFIKSFVFQEDMRGFLFDIGKYYYINRLSVRELYNELGLNSTEEKNDEDANIELSTVHGYKGLERDIVIMPWCHQYLEFRPGREINIEEERRLFYVAMTRTKNDLYLSYSGPKPKFIKEAKI